MQLPNCIKSAHYRTTYIIKCRVIEKEEAHTEKHTFPTATSLQWVEANMLRQVAFLHLLKIIVGKHIFLSF